MTSTSTVATEGKAPMQLAVMWTLTVLATACVVVRLGVRKHMQNFGLDDWMIGVSMAVGLSFVVAATVSIHYGYGQHYNNLSSERASKALLWNMISFIFGILACALPKLAVAAHLDRIWGPVLSLPSRIVMWGLTGTASLLALVNIVIYVTECNPRNALWTPTMVVAGQATCRDIWILIHFATFNGAVSAFVDLYLAIYPGFVFFRLLQMARLRKIALSAVFGLGSIAAVTAMVRCAQLKWLADLADPTYATVPLVIWTSVETNVMVIAACIPALLILRRFRGMSTGNGGSSGDNQPYDGKIQIPWTRRSRGTFHPLESIPIQSRPTIV